MPVDHILSIAIVRTLVNLEDYSELIQLVQYKGLPDTLLTANTVISATKHAPLHQLAHDMLGRIQSD